jgi:hypothetical protein
MIELVLTGAYRGKPHEVGAWAYALRRDGEPLGQGNGTDRPQAVTSRLAAEAAGLAQGLEDLTRDWGGEDVVVRTASAGLEGLLCRRGSGLARELRLWYERVRRAAAGCASVRILPATPEDLAALRERVLALLPAAPADGSPARACVKRSGGKERA